MPAGVWGREREGYSRRSKRNEGPLPSAITGWTFLNKSNLTKGGWGNHVLWEREYRLVKRKKERGYSSKGSISKWKGEWGAVNCSPTLGRRHEEGAQTIRNVLS